MGTTTSAGPLKSLGLDWSSEVVALFLKDWELGRVALSCHVAMDLLCQEMRDSPVSGHGFSLLELSRQTKASLSQWTGFDN